MWLTVLLCLAAAIVAIYAAAMIHAFVVQPKRVYKPLREIIDTPGAHGFSFEDVDLQSSGGIRLHGWWVPKPGAGYVLLFFHGNTRNISHCISSIALFDELGFSSFLFDYRGYGRSGGIPTEQGTYDDAEAAWRYLVEARGIDPARIVMHGRSLGAAIATRLAAEHPPAALVIESTFTSMPAAAAELYPLLPARMLMRYRYPVLQTLQRVHCPLLVVHGREDEIIPYRHGRLLYEAANEPKEFLDIEGRHYDGYAASGRNYYEGLAGFYRRHLAAGRAVGEAGPPQPDAGRDRGGGLA